MVRQSDLPHVGCTGNGVSRGYVEPQNRSIHEISRLAEQVMQEAASAEQGERDAYARIAELEQQLALIRGSRTWRWRERILSALPLKRFLGRVAKTRRAHLKPKCTEDILSSLQHDRVAIVGNATPRHAFGQIIDGYDIVIRLNNFRIAGFEELIGTKTHYRCTTGWDDIEHRNQHVEFSPFTAASAESGNLETFNQSNRKPVLTAVVDIHPFITQIPNPSTGFALAALCAHLGLSVDLFAFDGFKTSHYWTSDQPFFTTHSTAEWDILVRQPNVRLFLAPDVLARPESSGSR